MKSRRKPHRPTPAQAFHGKRTIEARRINIFTDLTNVIFCKPRMRERTISSLGDHAEPGTDSMFLNTLLEQLGSLSAS
jgi:hypothetical protein